MANGDKINVDLQKLEGSMQGIMNQMGLGVNVKGSDATVKKSKTVKKSSKGREGERSVSKPGSAANLGNQAAAAKPGGVGTVDKIGDVKPGKKKEDKSTVKIDDSRRRP
tara:strand:+ start:1750 stop:2076 length:327 start_codon:yes stop_codon:yes gene_type:complete